MRLTGLRHVTASIADAPIDLVYQVPDEEALPVVFDLLRDEGVGGAAG